MKENIQVYRSLSHSKWDCKYDVVFIPKKRRKAMFGRVRRYLIEIFHASGSAEGVPDSGRSSDA